jgi:hypothetical protein
MTAILLRDVSQCPLALRPALFEPARNCWRFELSPRVVLFHYAGLYCFLARRAILGARRSIFVLGWDFYAGLDLLPGGADDGAPRHLAGLLDHVVRQRRGLHCHVLVWDHAVLY